MGLEDREYQRFQLPESGRKYQNYSIADLRLIESKDTLLSVIAWGGTFMTEGLPAYAGGINHLPVVMTAPIIIDANGNGQYDPLSVDEGYILLGQ